MTDTAVVERVRALVDPIARDLGLEIYDVEHRGGTLRITLDTPPGSSGGVDLDQLSLATRLVSRELDHTDPVPGRYTLEVTSPGLERALRTPAHFRREIGKTISIRLTAPVDGVRRLQGVLVAADDVSCTIRIADGTDLSDRTIALRDVDRARTVFEWGPAPKPGKRPAAARSLPAQAERNES
jgi:ribosome maturation factor RimP